jgi:hypothetical protein
MTLGVARGLDERNGTKLRERLAPFVAHARNPGKDSLGAARTAASRQHCAGIRAWP